MRPLQCLVVLATTLAIACAQKIAPGVPPQHYVDPHYQQVPQMQYVQPGQPIHQQQQPMQPLQPVQHVQQPIQQQPIHQQPIQLDPNTLQQQQHQQHQQQQHHQQQQQMGGGVPQPAQRHPQQVLDTANIQGEKAHIQEHIDVPMDTSKMSEQELQFHYFKMHDSDHNNKLDGCELIKSLIHWHEKGNKEAAHHADEPGHHDKIFSDEELIALIDPILAMDDTGRDGYIDYPEFIKAQQKAASQQSKVEKP